MSTVSFVSTFSHSNSLHDARLAVTGWARDAVLAQPASDGGHAAPGDVLLEDAPHDRRGDRVRLEPVEVLAAGGLARVGVRAGVGEPVAVGRPSAEKPAFQFGLCLHRRPDADLDAVPLALAHAATERHDEIVGVRAGVDGAADLGHPQADAVVHEDREAHAELAAVEGALRFADDHGLEVPRRALDRIEQAQRLGSPLPRQRAGQPDVEELRDDFPAGRLDEVAGSRELPRLGCLRVLLVFG
jgi:hypothetical protein